MPQQTPEQYYLDQNSHGKYQYTTLKDIVDNMLLEANEDDSYLKNVKRSKIVNHARQAIRTVSRQAASDVLAIEITVPDTLFWVLPQDYVNYARVSVVVLDEVTGTLRLHALDVNEKINTAIGYLQDNNGDLLFDNLGQILTADSSNGYNLLFKSYSFSGGYQPMLNTSKLSKFGEFVIDERRGCILFGSELMDKEIVIEYVSDGLQADLKEEEITVHQYLRDCIQDWIYFACIERKRNVPANEKQRALNRYKTTLHQCKIARANFDLLQIARAISAQSMAL
ncbi:hypothetical protein [Flavobacterium sp.]|uniref:hypothetical protein n=1 Tax=Flavobacterium sp. TaxID=239 RepID=UPI003751D77C